MLYEDYETEISKRILATVMAKIKDPVCLMGGWAVHLTVNVRYKQSTGREYLGSKDIDLGFHFSKTQTTESLRQSACAVSIKILKQMGFYRQSFRMVQAYHRETRRRLSKDEEKKTSTYNIFKLYVDPIVDNIPDQFREVMDFSPIDEPLLRSVFEGARYDEIDEFGVRFLLPKPDVLLATKIKALPNRQKDHKRHKDIADIYALIWYSGVPPGVLKSNTLHHISAEDIKHALSGINDNEYENASDAIGVPTHLLKHTFDIYIDDDVSTRMEHIDTNNTRWIMPFGINYETFTKLHKSLFQQQADTKPVSLDKLSSIASLGKRSTRANLRFLKSVGIVVVASPASYRLTRLGTAYAHAHVLDDKKALKQASLDLVKNSHLKSLSDMLSVNKGCSLDKIYSWIKAAGRYPDGTSAGGMHATESVGARTLLRIFQDAGLVSDNLLANAGSKPKSAPKKSVSTIRQKHSPIHQTSSFGSLSIQGMGNLEISDLDTLELAKSQLEILRKRIVKTQDATESG